MTGDGSGTQNSNEPKNSKFKQQQLPAWQPILTAGTVLPTFFVIGIAFVPIGVGLMYFSNQVNEVILDYTECVRAPAINSPNPTPDDLCSKVIAPEDWDDTNNKCICEVDIEIGDRDWDGSVYMYYGLTNFYQNHRRYVKSRDDKQLYGQIETEPSKDCEPFRQNNDTNNFYAPCGAIANSMFNDKITLQYSEKGADAWNDVPLLKTGIAWPSDKEYKFKNPDYTRSEDPAKDSENLKAEFEAKGLESPKDWKTKIWELDTENPDNNGFLNEDLIVWMRTAALPNFRKLYRKIDHQNQNDPTFASGLPADKKYRLRIEYNYKVVQFSGTKKIILATTSLLGGKNPFLGIAYIVVGCICLVLGVIFLFIHLRFGKTPQDIMNIGPRTPYTAN